MTSGSNGWLDGWTILFDLDGTLVESAPDLISAVNHALARAGAKGIPEEEARPLISRGARHLIEHGLRRSGGDGCPPDFGSLFRIFLDRYERHVADRSAAYPGVMPALMGLRTAGASLAVCTNKPTELAASLLQKLGMLHMFDAVRGPDSVSACKPDPSHLLETVLGCGGTVERAILVGDSDVDANCARAAGVPLILVSFGYSEVAADQLRPDVLLHHYDRLVESCRRLSGCSTTDLSSGSKGDKGAPAACRSVDVPLSGRRFG